MNLLGAVLYDPSTAASKATSSLLAMTAFDTVNLRVAVTIPAHGKIYVRIMGGAVTGATTVPTILLGVMNGATVIGRISPQDFPGTMNATTQSCPLYAEFVATGLTPGAMNLDLAYGVEVIVALTTIKYGGPNNATTNDAWGGISFQVWDPQPITANATLAVDANGRVDVSKVLGTAQTGRDLGAQLDATVSSRMATYTQPTGFLTAVFPATVASTTNITAGVITTTTNLTNAPVDSSGTTTLLSRLTGTRATNLDNLDAAISTRSTYAGTDTSGTTTMLSRLTAGRAAGLDNLDATTSSRLASASYTAPDNASITAIKAKTDGLTFTIAGYSDVNILKVNGITIKGTGTAVDPFVPV